MLAIEGNLKEKVWTQPFERIARQFLRKKPIIIWMDQEMQLQKILIIEDTEEIREAIKETLDKKYEVDAVATGADALKAVAKKVYSLILMDVGLPDDNGFELWAKIQRIYKAKSTSIFFLTGRDDVFDKITAFSLGADDYLVKPFNLLEMEARVDARMQKILDQAS